MPAIAAIGLLCGALHVEPLALAWTLVLAIAGGALSPYGLLLASLSAGSIVAAAALLLRRGGVGGDPRAEVTVRGPLSYAGPARLAAPNPRCGAKPAPRSPRGSAQAVLVAAERASSRGVVEAGAATRPRPARST